MKNLLLLLFFSCIVSAPLLAEQTTEDSLTDNLENPGYMEKPDWFKNSFLDIREDIAEATEEGRRLLLYFHQDGCPYCQKLLEDNFGQKEIADLTQNYFDAIAINMWGDREVTDFNGEMTTEKEFAKQLRVQFTPTILLLTETGQVALRINGYYAPHKFVSALNYVGEGNETKIRFRDYFAKQNPVAASGQLHNDPTFLQPPFKFADTSRSSDKPLLVFFEQKQCLSCDELHNDILQREISKELLPRFNVAVVDMWSKETVQTPDGQSMPIRKWAADLNVMHTPGMVFFDKEGKEVFRTEGYLKAFHTHSAMEYVADNVYLQQPEFQRFVEHRADDMRARGIEVDIMK